MTERTMQDKAKALSHLLEAIGGNEPDEHIDPEQAKGHAAQLLKVHSTLIARGRFSAGDIVMRDPEIGSRYRLPSEGQPCLVIESLEEPIRDMQSESGSQHFASPCDTRVMIYRDGELVTYWFWHKELLPFPIEGNPASIN